MLCDYGCGNPGKFLLKSSRLCCSKSYQGCSAIKQKNSNAIKLAHKEGRVPGWKELKKSGKISNIPYNLNKFTAEFVLNGKGRSHKNILLLERGHRCEQCQNTKWLNRPIPLELDHVDGNNKNHVKENLKLLCPNCHAQTPTYRGKNIKRKRSEYVTDEQLINALKTNNIADALREVGLVAKGGNYARCKRLKRG